MDRRRITIIAAVSVVVVAVALALTWRLESSHDGYRASIYSVRVDADGTELIITYSKGECETTGRVVVVETADAVRLDVFVNAGTCRAMVEELAEVRVALDAPLGSRRVVHDESGTRIRVIRSEAGP
jgi:hypothetical protein